VTTVIAPVADRQAGPWSAAALRAGYAELLAAARASVAAAARGDADPVAWVRGVLEDRGQLPEPGARPSQVVADARAAMRLAGWTS
jgi:hypothetical protein